MNTISKKEYEKLDAEKIFGNKKKDHIDKFAAGEITFDEFDEIEQKKRNKGGKKIKPRNDPANQNDVMKMFNFNKPKTLKPKLASSLFDNDQEEVKLNDDENSMEKHKMNLGDILNELNLD